MTPLIGLHSVGRALPSKILLNSQFTHPLYFYDGHGNRMDKSPQSRSSDHPYPIVNTVDGICKLVGIRERRMLEEGDISDLLAQAYGVGNNPLDDTIFLAGTISGALTFPSVAARVQEHIGAKNCRVAVDMHGKYRGLPIGLHGSARDDLMTSNAALVKYGAVDAEVITSIGKHGANESLLIAMEYVLGKGSKRRGTYLCLSVDEKEYASPNDLFEYTDFLMQKYAISPLSVEGIIVALASERPSQAELAAQKVGVKNAQVVADIAAACAGATVVCDYVTARAQLGMHDKGFCGAGELLTRFMVPDDANSVLFGDAAAGFHVGPYSYQGLAHVQVFSDPFDGNLDLILDKNHHLLMPDGARVRKKAENLMYALIQSAVKRIDAAGFGARRMVIIPHPSNGRVTERLEEKTRDHVESVLFHREQIFLNPIDHMGNVSSCGAFVGFSEGLESGIIRAGDVVIVPQVGSGLVFGSSAWLM